MGGSVRGGGALGAQDPRASGTHLASRAGPRRSTNRASAALIVLGLPTALALCLLLTRGLGIEGRLTYVPAAWHYDVGYAKFDNTFGTWATDYMVAAICAAQGLSLMRHSVGDELAPLRARVSALLFLYAAATGLGGMVHQKHDGTHDALNSACFRLPWTLVVSCTVCAGALLGMIGSELARLRALKAQRGPEGADSPAAPAFRAGWRGNRRGCPMRFRSRVAAAQASIVGRGGAAAPPVQSMGGKLAAAGPDAMLDRLDAQLAKVVPAAPALADSAWLMWAVLLAVIVAAGGFSCQRPACDVFIAGATQALPTFFLQWALLPYHGRALPTSESWLLQASLLTNAPLIFVYPWFVQHSGLSLGAINAMLHAVLALSWGLQGAGLTLICEGRFLD